MWLCTTTMVPLDIFIHFSRLTEIHSRLAIPCLAFSLSRHPDNTAAAKSLAKINYRRLTEINSHYYGLSLLRTLKRGPEGVCNKQIKGVDYT